MLQLLAVIRNAAAPDDEVGLEIQDWQIVPVGDTLDLFLIRNRASGMVLTAEYIEINPPGAAVATAKAAGKGNRFQQWRLYPDD